MALGDIRLDLDGETFALQLTLEAFTEVPAQFGGFVGAFRRLAEVDVQAIASMVAIGTGKAKDAKERKRIVEKLFEGGLEEAIGKLTEWLSLLSAGGLKRKEAQSESSGE